MTMRKVEMSVSDIGALMGCDIDKKITVSILELFVQYGLSYKVTTNDDVVFRIYCYIKKSKEALILNNKGYKFGSFELQLRIKDLSTFEKLDMYSENVRNLILYNNRNCHSPHCCNCGSEYQFQYGGNIYRKCHMLCDNFYFYNLKEEDISSILSIIQKEISYGMPKKINRTK